MIGDAVVKYSMLLLFFFPMMKVGTVVGQICDWLLSINEQFVESCSFRTIFCGLCLIYKVNRHHSCVASAY